MRAADRHAGTSVRLCCSRKEGRPPSHAYRQLILRFFLQNGDGNLVYIGWKRMLFLLLSFPYSEVTFLLGYSLQESQDDKAWKQKGTTSYKTGGRVSPKRGLTGIEGGKLLIEITRWKGVKSLARALHQERSESDRLEWSMPVTVGT